MTIEASVARAVLATLASNQATPADPPPCIRALGIKSGPELAKRTIKLAKYAWEVTMSLSPGELAQGNYCLYEVSKNLTGQLTLAHAHQPVCSSPSCNPLVHEQLLLLDVAFNKDCDSQLLKTALDGVLLVRYFVTVFTGPRETLRGVHAGQYDWTPAAGGRITGTLEGISNAGVLRPTIFRPDCERCDEAGIVSGHLFGTGNGVPGVPMPDFQLDAVYRLAWDPLAWDFANPHPLTAPVRGTLEGVLIVTCQ